MEYIVTAGEMKGADAKTIEVFGLGANVLMERAAFGVVRQVRRIWKKRRPDADRGPRVLIFAGPGGNGGDGIAAARLFHQSGCDTLLVTVGEIAKFHEMAAAQLETAMKYAVPMIRLKEADEAEAVRMVTERRFDFLVDAVFGIGVTRPLTGVFSAAVATMEQLKHIQGDKLCVLSVDIPSGINTDTGEVCGIAVHADCTLTVNHKKAGLVLYPGAAYAGEIAVMDAGITADSFLEEMPALLAYNEPPAALLPPRDPSGNKGTFGKLLIVAGCGEIGGAAILAARGALAAGVGMVRIFTEKKNRTAILSACPEALIDVWDETLPADRMLEPLRDALSWADACVAGCGIGTGETAAWMLSRILSEKELPLVLDADACRLIARRGEIRAAVRAYMPAECWPVLTPHVGEFAEMSQSDAAAVKKNLLTSPRALAEELQCTILCKDARSVTAQAGRREQVLNLTGNSGMATAGSGDVLAGIAGALAAQGLSAYETAGIGAYLHGLAGDAAARKLGGRSMKAGDIADALGGIIK